MPPLAQAERAVAAFSPAEAAVLPLPVPARVAAAASSRAEAAAAPPAPTVAPEREGVAGALRLVVLVVPVRAAEAGAPPQAVPASMRARVSAAPARTRARPSRVPPVARAARPAMLVASPRQPWMVAEKPQRGLRQFHVVLLPWHRRRKPRLSLQRSTAVPAVLQEPARGVPLQAVQALRARRRSTTTGRSHASRRARPSTSRQPRVPR